MKKIQLILFCLFLSISIFAQIKIGPKIQWDGENWSWGKIIMEQGTVSHTFNFINVGDEPVKILKATPSCGCTIAEWTTQSILPGKSGFVNVKFDPKGKLGMNSKFVTVVTNTKQSQYILSIHAEVITNKWLRSKYKYQYGNLAVIDNKIDIGSIKDSDSSSFDISLANIGKRVVQIKKIFNSPNIKISHGPLTIGIEDEFILKCRYTPIKPIVYGENLQEILILTDDDTLPLKSFKIKSIVEEDFSKWTSKQRRKAPVISFDKIEEQFGTISDIDVKTSTFKLTNSGKSDLIIHKIENKCEYIDVKADKLILKNGEFASITVKYSPKKYIGVDERYINIISNDPKKSNLTLTIKSYVLPAE